MLFYNKPRKLHTYLLTIHKQKQPAVCQQVVESCGGRTRTCDLQVMSLASYQLLHSAILFNV